MEEEPPVKLQVQGHSCRGGATTWEHDQITSYYHGALPCVRHTLAPSVSRSTHHNLYGRRSLVRGHEKSLYSDKFSVSGLSPGGANRDQVPKGRYMRTKNKTETPQASSTRYLLRVIVISVTIVPRSSRSDSACWERVEDCPIPSPSYEGRESKPTVSSNNCEGTDTPSTFTGISLQIRWGKRSSSVQVHT